MDDSDMKVTRDANAEVDYRLECHPRGGLCDNDS